LRDAFKYVPSRKGITMRMGYCLAALWLSALIAAPVLAQTTSPAKSPAPAATTAPKTATPEAPDGSREQGGLVDINAASAEELDRLPGVGPARAKAIISHRPYSGKDDLVRRKIITQNVYDQIKDKIIARQGSAQAPAPSAGSPAAAAKSK
jgi:competence ComEA-like helix-hairpin-helix protein